MSDLEQSLAQELLCALEDGSPVAPAGLKLAQQMAVMARRRWKSFPRRHPTIADTPEARIEDLARGLAEKFNRRELTLVGPLLEDYRWIAMQLAPRLSETDS